MNVKPKGEKNANIGKKAKNKTAYATYTRQFAFPIIAQLEKKPYEALWTSIGCY